MQLALDRAVNDYHVYECRRAKLNGATRLDCQTEQVRENAIQEQVDLLNRDNSTSHPIPGDIDDYHIQECLKAAKGHPEMSGKDFRILTLHLSGADVIEISKETKLEVSQIKARIVKGVKILKEVVSTVKF